MGGLREWLNAGAGVLSAFASFVTTPLEAVDVVRLVARSEVEECRAPRSASDGDNVDESLRDATTTPRPGGSLGGRVHTMTVVDWELITRRATRGARLAR